MLAMLFAALTTEVMFVPTAFTLLIEPATVPILAVFPETVVTSPEIPATVVTLAAMPETVSMFVC